MSRWGGRHVTDKRRAWQPRIDAGEVRCARCGKPIAPGQRWDLGHAVDRARGGTERDGLAPEHARCNRSAGGRLGAAATNGRRASAVARLGGESSRGIRGW